MRPAGGGRHPGARRHHTGWPAPGHVRNGVAPPFVVRRALHVNDLVRGEHCLRQAAALAPGDAHVRARLARALVEQGKKEEALAQTRRSLELDSASTRILDDAGVVHSTVGDFDTAREHYRAALALDPGNPKAALNLAKSKRFAGQLPASGVHRHHPAGGDHRPLPARPLRQRDFALLHRLHGRPRVLTTCAPSGARSAGCAP